MKYYQPIEITDIELDYVMCDRCNVKININKCEFWDIKHSGGYWSNYPGDLQEASCQICENCAKALFGDFIRINRK